MKLRQYQVDCASAVFNSIIIGNKKIGVVMPTGSGKTTVFGSIVKRYTEENPMKRAVVISHLGLLTSQTSDRFESEWGLKSGVLQADRYPNKSSKVVITTMQSFRDKRKLERWSAMLGSFNPSVERLDVGLIIIDESHYAGAESYQEIMEMFPNAIVLGFTATPFRENKLMTNIFDDIAYSCSMGEMIDQGYLVPPLLKMTKFNTTDPEELYSQMVDIIRKFHKGEKVVMYMKTIAEAKELRNVLVSCGITSEAVTSELTGASRDNLLKNFRNNTGPDVLTTVDVLTAGFDSPNLRAIFIPYKVGSIVTYLQRVGRGLRPDKDKDVCYVYTGSTSPGVEEGFWEKLTNDILKLGKPKHDRFDDDLEYLKGIMSSQDYEWTRDVVELAKKVDKTSHNLSEMIMTKKFPDDLLDHFVENPPVVYRDNGDPATDRQKATLAKFKLPTEVTKKEASSLIDGCLISKGIKKIAAWETVPSGKFAGKSFNSVPKQYWMALKFKQSSGDLYQSYLTFIRTATKNREAGVWN